MVRGRESVVLSSPQEEIIMPAKEIAKTMINDIRRENACINKNDKSLKHLYDTFYCCN